MIRQRPVGVLALFALAAAMLASVASADDFLPPLQVNSTGDSGDSDPGNGICETGGLNALGGSECTLRAALEEMEAFGARTVTFNIPIEDGGYDASSGGWRIEPVAALPHITRHNTTIDATTQPGFVEAPLIMLAGTQLGGSGGMLTLDTNDSSIIGLSLIDWTASGIVVTGANLNGQRNVIQKTWIGATTSNTVDGLSGDGIELLDGAGFNVIGGPGPADGVVIVATHGSGVIIDDSSNNTIQNSFLGVLNDPAYTAAGSSRSGVEITGTSLDNLIGGVDTGNVIAWNSAAGVKIPDNASLQNAVLANYIFGNGGSGIDLGRNGRSLNDAGDGDAGANDMLNFPQIDSAIGISGSVEVDVTMDVPSGPYVIDYFVNPVGADGSGYGEGQIWVDSIEVPSVVQGGSYTHVLAINPGDVLTATATQGTTANPGSTSEFSQAVVAELGLIVPNVPPQLSDIADQVDTEGDAVLLTPVVTDPDSTGPFTWTAVGLPDGLSIDPVTGVISGSASYDSAGPHSVTLTVTDSGSPALSDTSNFEWTVVNVNRAPTIVNPGNQTSVDGESVSLFIDGDDPDADTLTYTAFLPAGLSIDPLTGEISGVAQHIGGVINVVTVFVSDGDETVSIIFDWLVTAAPTTTTTAAPTTTTTAAPTTTTTAAPTTTTTAAPTTTTTAAAPTTTTLAPTTTTTLAPTTTTTAAPTTTTSTTAAPTTTTTAAPTTTTTTAPTTTTRAVQSPAIARPTTRPAPAPPSTTIPRALGFVELSAEDDSLASADTEFLLDVLSNDTYGANTQIVSVTQPAVGSVAIKDGQLAVELPASFAGDVAFDYTITDESGAQSTASVQVRSANVLAPVGDVVQSEPVIDSVSDAFQGAGKLFNGLVEIRLSSMELSILALAPFLFGILRWMFLRREDLVSVTNVSRSKAITVMTGSGAFDVRHDALLWGMSKTRKFSKPGEQRLVHLPDGRSGWIDARNIVDTGF